MKSENSRLRAAKEEKLARSQRLVQHKGLFTPAPEGETALRLSTLSQISSDVLEETLSSPLEYRVSPARHFASLTRIWHPQTVTV